jgi:phage shock protein PspC (stress-responsive transcriptional regulator)
MVPPGRRGDDGHMTSYPEPNDTSGTVLRRPRGGRILAGVAVGIADYLGVDVTIVRIAFVVLTLVGGIGIPAYLAGWLLMPSEGAPVSALEQWLATHR